jgi:Domain of unknown function (DUF1877)
MSMICRVLGLSLAQIGELRRRPSLASDLARVTQDEQLRVRLEQLRARRGETTTRMSPEPTKPFEAQYRTLLDEARGRLASIGPFEQALDLEKSWHILHFLFTGHIAPYNAPGDALLTGADLGEDVGYGPARLHDELETQEFDHFLEMLDLVQLQARVNFQEMTRLGVYSMPTGPGSDAEYESELRAEVARYFPLLRDYVAKMSEKQYGLLIWVS